MGPEAEIWSEPADEVCGIWMILGLKLRVLDDFVWFWMVSAGVAMKTVVLLRQIEYNWRGGRS